MSKIASLADLKNKKKDLQDALDLRVKGDNADKLVQIKVGMATCGIASGAKETFEFFNNELGKRSIEGIVTQTGCLGYCHSEPTIEVKLPNAEPVLFGPVDTTKADEIIEKYIKNGELVDGIIPVNFKTIDE